MNVVFFGTPFFAAECLNYLLERKVRVAAVVTQPDKPKGRSLQLAPSPVKRLLLERAPSIPLFQPAKASESSFLKDLAECGGDLFVVVAYGQILSQKLLDIPRFGCINAHASLLPKYRGAAPIQRCLMAGETETGIAIQKMALQMDAGDLIALTQIKIPCNMTFGELQAALLKEAQPLLFKVIDQYEREGIPSGIPQRHEEATYAPKIDPEEGKIDWSFSSDAIHNLIRAFSPKPGAWCWFFVRKEKKRLKILRSRKTEGRGVPGNLILKQGIVICGSGAVELLEVQLEGKPPMKGSDWMRGYLQTDGLLG